MVSFYKTLSQPIKLPHPFDPKTAVYNVSYSDGNVLLHIACLIAYQDIIPYAYYSWMLSRICMMNVKYLRQNKILVKENIPGHCPLYEQDKGNSEVAYNDTVHMENFLEKKKMNNSKVQPVCKESDFV